MWMPDLLPEGVSSLGLMLLLFTTFVAGVVYGFAGFGAALIFLPVAARIVPLEVAIAVFNISAVASVFTVVPQAWARSTDRPLPCRSAWPVLRRWRGSGF